MTLSDLAAQFDSDSWAQQKAEFAAYEAEQETAAYLAEMEEEKAMGIGPADPTLTAFDGQDFQAGTPQSVRHALEHGRALITVRSRESGKHVTILIIGRKKKPGGKGWVPRTTSAGRVGWGTGADALEVRDVLREYPENYVGRLYMDSGEWKAGKDADGIRVWTAEKVLEYATGAGNLAANADVYLATQCSVCGKQLTDPVSIERNVGPECWGKQTGSKVAH